MDELLRFIAEVGECDEDTVVRCNGVAWTGAGLSIELEASTFEWGENARHIQIVCEDVLSYTFTDEVAQAIELTQNHPLLWQFKQDSASAFLYGAPPDAYSAIGALYEVHRNAVGNWISFECHINAQQNLHRLLSGGNGLLATGPVPLLDAYKAALGRFGVEVQIIDPYPAGGRMSPIHVQERIRNETKALLLGSSYVTGIGWTAR